MPHCRDSRTGHSSNERLWLISPPFQNNPSSAQLFLTYTLAISTSLPLPSTPLKSSVHTLCRLRHAFYCSDTSLYGMQWQVTKTQMIRGWVRKSVDIHLVWCDHIKTTLGFFISLQLKSSYSEIKKNKKQETSEITDNGDSCSANK